MDGLSVLQGLRRMGITTPVIITTALDGVNDRIDGLDAGADDYLVKPYASGELLLPGSGQLPDGPAGWNRAAQKPFPI